MNADLADFLLLADNLTTTRFATLEAAISDDEQPLFGYARAAQRERATPQLR